MSEEIAGLFVKIEADVSGLLGALDETQAILAGLGGEEGLLGQLPAQVPAQMTQLVGGIQTALAPLPALLNAGLRQPIESVMSGIKSYLAQQIQEMISSLYAMAAQVHSIAGQLGVPSPIHSEALQGRASGGSVMSGTPYLVGEAGPEIFVPGSSGSIIPNHALGGEGSGVSIQGGTFHIYGVQDVEGLYDQLQQVARQRG